MFKVIKDFTDLEDNNHLYSKGDIFPFEKKEIKAERIDELTSKKNKRKTVLIKLAELKDFEVDALFKYAKACIDVKSLLIEALNDEKNIEELKQKATEMGINYDENISVQELQKLIDTAEKEK